MLDMARKDIMPAMSAYTKTLSESALKKTELCSEIDCTYERENVKDISLMLNAMYKQVKKLELDLLTSKSIKSSEELADYYKDTIIADMAELRVSADEMETIASGEMWPYPSYGELLFGVR